MTSTTVAPGASGEIGRIAFEAFLAQHHEDGMMEWVDGRVLVMTPASVEHQRVRDFLLMLMRAYVEHHQVGEVISAPFVMRLPTRPSGREPDLLFVTMARLSQVRSTYLDGPADLVVEIISPESDARDRGEKFVEYEGAGIAEYWIIDPLRNEAFFYVLDQDGHYRQRTVDHEGVYHSSAVTGFWLVVDWLWQRPLPAAFPLIRRLIG